jgi:Na+-transporting NADH:ubiquinone oxidoreductase subunit B
MRRVLYSLIPIVIASIFFFGWRTIALLIVVIITGIATEYFFANKRKQPVSEAVIVSCVLYTLTLPPTLPFWIAIVGIVFGITFGKELFGGFGKNIFNPALVGRSFIYISFANPMTINWTTPITNIGGFTQWIIGVDSITSSTPMINFQANGILTPYIEMVIGNIGGSIGETSAILIILAAIYLIKTKTASWQIMTGVLIGFLSLSTLLYALGIPQVPPPIWGLLSGGVLFGTVYMATDPISAPTTKEGKWIYGILIGIIIVVIRGYSLFSGGVMFAILIGNTFAPLIDTTIVEYKKRKVSA